VVDGPVFHLENDIADIGLTVGKTLGEIPPHHPPDDAVFRHLVLFHVQRLDGLAVAQDGDAVRHLHDLVQLVGNDDGGDAPLLELFDEAQQIFAVFLVERGGRLVEDEELHFLGQRLGDLHQLLLADAEMGHQRARIFVQPHKFKQLSGADDRLVPVDDEAPLAFVAEKNVFRYGQPGDEIEFLVDDDDAQLLALLDVPELAHFSPEQDFALIGAVGVDAAQHLHERGFPGAVLAAEGVDFAFPHLQVDVVQRRDAGKPLGDVAHFQNVFRHPRPSLVACAKSARNRL